MSCLSTSWDMSAGVMLEALVAADPHADNLAVGVHPDVEPRLVLGGDAREDVVAYRRRAGYGVGVTGPAFIEAVAQAGLLGRGGAAFPTAVKLRSLADRPGPKYVVANGDEGEPASIKDRWLMRKRPHLVLDGLFRAAEAVNAEAAYVYLSDGKAKTSIETALDELGSPPLAVTVFKVEPGYVTGEETSVVRALNGGPAKPTDKPPRPFESGVAGRPTLVSNIETLANLPWIATRGPQAFRETGRGETGAGTVLLTVSGAVLRPGLYEVPLGASLGQVLDAFAGLQAGARGFLMGGFFAGLLNRRALDLAVSYLDLKTVDSGLGCGAIVVIGANDCPVAAAADVMAYFARENAGQCGACFRGTPAMSKVISALSLGGAAQADIEKLKSWSISLRGRGACATLDGAAQLADTLLREFPEEIEMHRTGCCDHCQRLVLPGAVTRFAVGFGDGAHVTEARP